MKIPNHFIILLWLLAVANAEISTAIDQCQNIWRPEKLVGKCFTLYQYNNYVLKINDKRFNSLALVNVTSAEECRAICCELGEHCITWQYEFTTNNCQLAKIVRLGLEKTGTPGWCDPFPEMKWYGQMIKYREKELAEATHKNSIVKKADNFHGDGEDSESAIGEGNICKWSSKILYKQCFGLGDEQKHPVTGAPLTRDECAEACSRSPNCRVWQHHPDRGCYYTKKKIKCKQEKDKIYTGGRKCVKNYCSGLEDKLLAAA